MAMEMNYKEAFIKFMADSGVLLFGSFTLKSGRIAPYFINTGKYATGMQLAKLGEFYAECLMEHKPEFETLYGPAYKGITLASCCAVALYKNFNMDVNYVFNRKEAKDHGEGGILIGRQPQPGEKVVIVEDVMSSGKALRESLPILESVKAQVTGMIISVDRQERGTGTLSAVQEAKETYGIPVYSIVTMRDIIDAIEKGVIGGREYLEQMRAYRAEYGVED